MSEVSKMERLRRELVEWKMRADSVAGRAFRAESALSALYEWYDRDGSVGGADIAFETHRAALPISQGKQS